VSISTLVSDSITNSIINAINLNGGIGLHLIGMDSRVDFSRPFINNTIDGSYLEPEILRSVPYSAWSLTTAFGGEIAVKITVISNDPSGEIHDSIECSLQIRADCEEKLFALNSDISEFIYSLGAGCLVLV
jgi:hypothetical protein